MPGQVPTPLGQLATDPVDPYAAVGNTTAQLVTGAAATQTAALPAGIYDLWSTQDTFVLTEDGAATVTVSNGYQLRANNTVPFIVRANSRISAIAAGAGTLNYCRVG